MLLVPENRDTVLAFDACQSQWRHGPSGHRTGLDYAGCRAAVAGVGLKWREVFDGLTVMEAEVLRISAENRE